MKPEMPALIKHISLILTIILFVKIGGYFSIVEERAVNQVFKTISRMGMTVCTIWIYVSIRKLGCLSVFKYEQVLAPFLYILYLTLGFASFGWSSDVKYSVLQWLMTFESFVFTCIYVRVIVMVNHHFQESSINLTQIFAHAIFPIMLIFLIGSFVDPDTFYRGMRGGEEKRLGGWIMNPNELGMLASIGAAMTYLQLQKGLNLYTFIMLIVAILILLMTSSRSSAIGFLMIIGLLIIKSQNRQLKVAMFLAGLILGPILVNQVIFKESGGMEEVLSMTGRLPFWKALLNEGIVKEPFFGYGFMRINYTDYFQGLNTYPAKMTHNTFMQVLMNLGFVGLFICFWQMVATLKGFFCQKGHPYRAFFVALFIPILINSFTEFGIFGEANYAILFYQFLILLFVIKIRKHLTQKEQLQYTLFLKRWSNKNSTSNNSFPK